LGHSDGDALIHSIIDALLGALGSGDIGTHFPPDDPAYHDISSLTLLSRVIDMVSSARARIVNLDTTVFLERPRVSAHSGEIAKTLAGAMGVSAERISVKAKTMEGVGPIGEGKAYAAMAIVLLEVG
jgi:2-C-methyl-D-erythritol 2,4-cyclodiphosphate synthase